MRPQTHHTASVTHHCSLLLETAAERLGTLRSRRWERAQEVAWLACVSFGDRQQRRATPEHWFREAMERSSRVGGGGGQRAGAAAVVFTREDTGMAPSCRNMSQPGDWGCTERT